MKTYAQFLSEAKMKDIKNPILKKAYGVETFGEFYEMVKENFGEKMLKKMDGFIIDNKDSVTPIKYISIKDKAIHSIGMNKGALAILRTKQVFDVKDMTK